jgi:hypothetical protein
MRLAMLAALAILCPEYAYSTLYVLGCDEFIRAARLAPR